MTHLYAFGSNYFSVFVVGISCSQFCSGEKTVFTKSSILVEVFLESVPEATTVGVL